MVAAQTSLLDRVFHFLTDNPSPDEVLEWYATEAESARIGELSEKNRAGTLTVAEQQEIEQYLLAERYVRLAKAKALERLAAQ